MSKSMTPMMEQYFQIKKSYNQCILFFRMGDFYEMFYDDAIIVSSALGIFLTKKSTQNEDIPMCGIPFHSYETYLSRLIKLGYKVAICEQTETPQEAKKRGYKAVVNREVVRVVTQGTLVEDSLLESSAYNYLVSIYKNNDNYYVSWIDISTNDFYIKSVALLDLNNMLYKLSPREIVLMSSFPIADLASDWHKYISFIDKGYQITDRDFSLQGCGEFLKDYYGDNYINIEYFSIDEKYSLYILLSYVCFVYKKINVSIIPKKDNDSMNLKMDLFTRKSLEINKTNSGDYLGSLLHVIDYTKTKFGSRLLSSWINNPLADRDKIQERLSMVEFFYSNNLILNYLRDLLVQIPDVERSMGRLLIKKGSHKDLLSVAKALNEIDNLKMYFVQDKNLPLYDGIVSSATKLSHLRNLLNDSLNPEPINSWRDGGFIRVSFNNTLKSFVAKKDELISQIHNSVSRYIVKYNLSSLKIDYNNVSGYYLEISAKNSKVLSNNDFFIHKQTLSNTVRYTTSEIMDLEREIDNLSIRINSLEMEILEEILLCISKNKEDLLSVIAYIARLDILTSFAFLALRENLTMPILHDGMDLEIIEGRHLVIQNRLKESQDGLSYFIPNNCIMKEDKNIFLITGPNMSGKSTYLRQNAIIILLAQMGSFVPAKFAKIGIVDAIFSRVGASDDLFKGQSTFMVEMMELSAILNQATERSFLILDEIGRGTSTYDGLSIAWSTLEYLHNIVKSKVLFATHYHELVELENELKRLECHMVKIEEKDNKIIFLYEIKKGYVNKSYGIEVGKLAGLPVDVVKRAYEVLSSLESKNYHTHKKPKAIQETLDLGDYKGFESKGVISLLQSTDVNSMTPIESMNFLYKIKNMCSSK